jgi:hypothetical protein
MEIFRSEQMPFWSQDLIQKYLNKKRLQQTVISLKLSVRCNLGHKHDTLSVKPEFMYYVRSDTIQQYFLTHHYIGKFHWLIDDPVVLSAL